MISQAAKAAGGFGCAILTLPLLAALIVATLLGGGPSGSGIPAAPSKRALADIPRRMLAIYLRAAPECRGLPWTVLAAIGKVETDHGRARPMVSSAHAVGPMQFKWRLKGSGDRAPPPMNRA